MPIEEQKFGLEGVERDQGFEPMPIAHPVDVPEPDHMSEHELSHFRRPEPAQPEIREYRDVNTGKEIPANQTVSAEQAASDLHSARAQERAAREQLAQDDLKFALDQLPSQEGGPQPAQQSPEAPQPELDGIQPEQTDPTQTQDPWAEADKQIGEMLKDPVVRERIEAEYSHVVQQANAVAEQAKQQAAAVINNLAQEANLVASALFPELAGLSPEQVQGALRVMKPERVAQVREFANKIQGIANVAQQQAFAQQQAQQQQAELQQRQAAEAFQRYAAEQDAKALAKETPESLAQIRNVLYEDGKKEGYSKADIDQAWNTIPALRNAYVSELIADGAKWRMSQRALATHRANPIPKVQRPGVASDGPSDNNEYASLERSLRGKDLNPKQAADLLIAHRARR